MTELLDELRQKHEGTTTQQYECEVCGEKFDTPQGLGGHATKHANEAKRAKKSQGKKRAVSERVQAILENTLAPLQAEADRIDARLNEITTEAAELRATRATIDRVIRSVGATQAASPAQKKKKGSSRHSVSSPKDLEKMAAVISYLDTHGTQLLGGFTGDALWRLMKDDGVQPRMSGEKVRGILSELQDQGIVRAHRVVKGGGMSYRLVSNGRGADAPASS